MIEKQKTLQVESADFDINFTSASICTVLPFDRCTEHICCILLIQLVVCAFLETFAYLKVYSWQLPDQSLLLEIDEYAGYL